MWFSKTIEEFKHHAHERRDKKEHAQAVVRTQNQIHNFWKDVISNIEQRPISCRLPENIPHQLQDFLADLDVPLEQYPRAEEIGLPVLQLYFLSRGDVQAEHSLLAVALEAGLPVTPQLCQFFVDACALAPVGNLRSCGLYVPPRFLKSEYTKAENLAPFVYTVQYRQQENPTWPHSEKYAAGAKLLEAFGADWRTVNSHGVSLGQQLHVCLNHEQRTAFAKYVATTPTIDVDAIVEKHKAEQQSRIPRMKI